MEFRPTPLLQSPEPDTADGGGFVETPTPSTGTTATPEPASTGTQGSAAPAGTEAATGPKDMLEAMFGQKPAPATEAEKQEAAAAGKTVQQLRDERGRFAGKAPLEPAAAKPLDPKAKPEGEDLTQMPEGLTAKAQQRFQALANSNKELSAKVAEVQPIVEQAMGLQKTFQQNGIKREQFDQAMQVVGLMNRGDLRGALAALDEQRKLISLTLGEALPGADALADFPDLRRRWTTCRSPSSTRWRSRAAASTRASSARTRSASSRRTSASRRSRIKSSSTRRQRAPRRSRSTGSARPCRSPTSTSRASSRCSSSRSRAACCRTCPRIAGPNLCKKLTA
jgi:hypothetical protein